MKSRMIKSAFTAGEEPHVLMTCILCDQDFWLPDDSPPSARYGGYPICHACLEVNYGAEKHQQKEYLSDLEHDLRHPPS